MWCAWGKTIEVVIVNRVHHKHIYLSKVDETLEPFNLLSLSIPLHQLTVKRLLGQINNAAFCVA